MVCCLFLNTAELSESECPGSESCSLPPFLLLCQLPTVGPPAVCLLTVPASSAASPSPFHWCAFSNHCSLSFVLVFSSVVYLVFWVFFFFFAVGGFSLSMGVVLVYPRGGWGILCDNWLSSVWSAKGLLSTFGAGSWQLTMVAVWCWWPPVLSVYHGMEKPSTG
jgi:hypothetical protein